MRKPRRPRGLRDLGFDSYEFQLIGEIVVLCGLIEQLLRDLPLWLIGADRAAAHAFTAHLTFQSLCDLNLTLIKEYISSPLERESIEEGIKQAAPLFEKRNRIIHGPFEILASGIHGTVRVTARQQIRYQVNEYDRETLIALLGDFVDVYQHLGADILWQKAEWWLQVRSGD